MFGTSAKMAEPCQDEGGTPLLPGVVHASCVARRGHGVLLLGAPGAGKSDLALRLIDRGFRLVADDRVALVRRGAHLYAGLPCSALPAGLLEIRGLGLMQLRVRRRARLAVVLRLGAPDRVVRLPAPSLWHGVAALDLDPRGESAAQRAEWALDAALGRRRQFAGAFAA